MTRSALTDEELIAYFEDALSSERRAEIEARLVSDPEAQAKLADWARQNADIQALFIETLDEPVPEHLRAVLHQAPAPRRIPGLFQIAASLAILAVGATGGWVSHANLATPAAPVLLAQAAIDAHDTYAVEVVHPVEVPASERAHMDTWMTKRMGTQMRPPDLSASGFSLMGGRILPSAQGPAGLYMYENEDGKRITLYISRQDTGGDSAFQYTGSGPTQSLYWQDDGLGYAVVGDMPRARLKDLAKRTYDQLL